MSLAWFKSLGLLNLAGSYARLESQYIRRIRRAHPVVWEDGGRKAPSHPVAEEDSKLRPPGYEPAEHVNKVFAPPSEAGAPHCLIELFRSQPFAGASVMLTTLIRRLFLPWIVGWAC
jgi:hypothetical protein